MKPRAAPAFALLFLFLLAACTPVRSPDMEFRYPAPRTEDRDAAAVEAAVEAAGAITAASVGRHVAALAGDSRQPGTMRRGVDATAAYIAGEFRRLGLDPAGSAGGYLRPARRVSLERDSVRLRFEWGGRGVTLRYGADYVAVAGGGTVDARAMFLGDVDHAPRRLPGLTGAVPLVRLRGSLPDARDWAMAVRAPSRLAARDGVPALVFVLDPEFDASALPRIAAALEAPDDPAPVPAFILRHQAAERVLRAAGVDPDVIDAEPSSALPLKSLRVQAAAPAEPVAGEAAGVVALLRGSDSARYRPVVIASSGVGRDPSASLGTSAAAADAATLLEVAAAFARMGRPPARPVLFVAGVGAGEVEHPERAGVLATAFQDAAAVIRLHGIGGGDTVMIADDDGGLGRVFRQLAARRRLRLVVRINSVGDAPASSRPAGSTPGGAYGSPSAVVTDVPRAGAVDADRVARVARLVFYVAQRLSGTLPHPAVAPVGEPFPQPVP